MPACLVIVELDVVEGVIGEVVTDSECGRVLACDVVGLMPNRPKKLSREAEQTVSLSPRERVVPALAGAVVVAASFRIVVGTWAILVLVTALAVLIGANRLAARSTSKEWRVVGASLLFLSVHLVGVAIAPDPMEVIRFAVREGLAIAFGLSLCFLPERSLARVGLWLSMAGAAVICAYCCLYPLGLFSESIGRWTFVNLGHERLGGVWRFRGLSGSPSDLGFVLFALLILVLGLPNRRARRALSWAAALLVASTFSFPSLLLPIVPIWARIRSTRWRWCGGALVLVLALTALYSHPLSVRVGGRDLQLSTQRPRHEVEQVAALEHSVQTIGDDEWGLDFRGTAYFELARGAVSCFADHPWLGVGTRNFRLACPVVATDTYGFRGPHRVHNEYLGLLAERGLLGLAASLILLVVLVRRFRLTPDRWRRGALVAYLLCGMTWMVTHQIPFIAALVAMLVSSPTTASPPTPETTLEE